MLFVVVFIAHTFITASHVILFQLFVSAAFNTQPIGVDRQGSTEQNYQTYTGSILFNVWICSLLFVMVNEESLSFGQSVGQKKEFKDVSDTVMSIFSRLIDILQTK